MRHSDSRPSIPSNPRGITTRRRIARVCALALSFTVLWTILGTLPGSLPGTSSLTPQTKAEPNFFEKARIEAQAIAAFQRMVTLWQEEVYFELYGEGTEASKERLDLETFAQRMVELAWVPNGELNPKHLKADYRFRTMVYVSARVPYRHKFNPNQRFTRDQTLILLYEDKRWRIDLIELIRSPYSGG